VPATDRGGQKRKGDSATIRAKAIGGPLEKGEGKSMQNESEKLLKKKKKSLGKIEEIGALHAAFFCKGRPATGGKKKLP